MGRGGGKGRVWKTKEGIMKTSGIVDRGEDTIRNFEKVEQKGALTPPYLGKVHCLIKSRPFTGKRKISLLFFEKITKEILCFSFGKRNFG